ncbi:MAG: acetyl-coenzyme A carboxylase carboxyl transferase subunit beta [Planctomycetota bacterium]|nr:MAG: acetyl-coenzyme A carboxylase carboxyl transferase subunit beta [Planctomycetota bacterium]
MASLPWRRHRKKDIPGDLWVRCPDCGSTVFGKDLDDMLKVCPECGHHFPISSHTRIAYTLDPASWQELDAGMEAIDALGFVDSKPYPEKLAEAATKTGLKEAMRYGLGSIEGRAVVFGVLEFKFMGGSMGVVVGEKVTRAAELAKERGEPLILVAASGGARMHEGILSLMQMAKTCSALAELREAGGFFISICTHPTTGGVTASWAMAADFVIAEPEALVGFAGPRVIEGTIKKKLPAGFQRAEFLLEKGQLDLIVPRTELRATLSRLLRYIPQPALAPTESSS